jgi:hypothetical protein
MAAPQAQVGSRQAGDHEETVGSPRVALDSNVEIAAKLSDQRGELLTLTLTDLDQG